jgi:hypothetical protein
MLMLALFYNYVVDLPRLCWTSLELESWFYCDAILFQGSGDCSCGATVTLFEVSANYERTLTYL